jgi:hypothetical protein
MHAAKTLNVASPLSAEEMASPNVDHLGVEYKKISLFVYFYVSSAVMSYAAQLIRAKRQRPTVTLDKSTLATAVNVDQTVEITPEN